MREKSYSLSVYNNIESLLGIINDFGIGYGCRIYRILLIENITYRGIPEILRAITVFFSEVF